MDKNDFWTAAFMPTLCLGFTALFIVGVAVGALMNRGWRWKR